MPKYLTPNSSSFMNKNGEILFFTNEDVDYEELNNFLTSEQSETTFEELTLESITFFDEIDKMMISELYREGLRCNTPECGGTKVSGKEYCYYCIKKQEGLIGHIAEYTGKEVIDGNFFDES